MPELTKEQIEKQDAVDNAVWELITDLSPVPLEWDILIIAEVRELIWYFLLQRGAIGMEMDFYPYIESAE